jgi:hypothetical protein
MGKTPAGDIAPGNLHGDNSLAQADTGEGFFFKFADAFPLCFGKAVNLLVGKSDILFDRFRNGIDEALFFFLAEDKIAFPSVKFPGELDDGILTVFSMSARISCTTLRIFWVSDSAVLAAFLMNSIASPLFY